MAENGRRDVVGDPLALNPAAQMADRSLATIGVRNPGKSGGQDAVYASQMGLLDSLGNLAGAVNKVVEEKTDEYITEGQLAFMQGKTEEEIAATGNKYTMQGWQGLAAVEAANNWYANELNGIQNGAYSMDPAEYNKTLVDKRKGFLSELPDDPAIRKIYAAAFENLGPRLTNAQTQAHNTYNTQQTENSFMGALSTGANTNDDATKVIPGGVPLAMSAGQVRTTVAYSDQDVDVLTRTILGEAGGEGATGMAAVAHVIMNRVVDGSYGSSISGVATADKQFSTWNKGAGGNNPGKWDANSKAYQNARNIAMSVLSGHHVDPTGGATHFFSQAGMDKLVRDGHQTNRTPAWWNEKVGQSGGSVTIGSHQFAGRAANVGPVTTGRAASARGGGILKFSNKGQEGIQEHFAGILTSASAALGRDLTITSGYRSPEHNAKVGGANESRHVHGDAADIDMSGMSNNERAELVQTLRAQGVKRFGTYDNHPNMLHVDMSEANGGNWFMHNKSNSNMSKAPAWFQQVAASPIPQMDPNVAAGAKAQGKPGQAISAETPSASTYSGPQTQVQEFIRSDPMPAARKGELVAQSMVTELASGNDQLFRDAGGVAILQELNAPQALIRQVIAAKEAFDKDQLNKFDVESLKWENDLVLKVDSGELTSDEALTQLDARRSQNQMTDQKAQSIAAKVLAQAAKQGAMPNMDPTLLRAVSGLYNAVGSLTMSPEEATAKLNDLADVHDIPRTQLNGFIAKMWNEEEQAIAKQRTAIATAAAKKQEQDGRKDLVRNAISNGTGLSTLSGIGSIDGVDPETGTPRSYSAQQWGIQQIKDQAFAAAKSTIADRVAAGATQEEAMQGAKSEALKTIYRNLRRQGVVDEDMRSQMTGALTGNIIGKDGKIDPAAIEAFDVYLQLSRDSEIGDMYMADYLSDPQAKNLAENAAALYNGAEFGIEQSLRKSAEVLDPTKFTPAQKINADVRFNTIVAEELTKNIDKITNNEGWFTRSGVNNADRQAAVENDGQLRTLIERRARQLHAMTPMNNPEVTIKRAANEIMKDAIVVGGNFVMPMDNRAPSVQKAMGLENEARDLPNKLISNTVLDYWRAQRKLRQETGADKTGWGSVETGLDRWTVADRDQEWLDQYNPGGGIRFHAEYVPSAGAMRIRLWKDEKRTELADAEPILIPLAELGAKHIRDTALMGQDDGPNPFQRMMNWITE